MHFKICIICPKKKILTIPKQIRGLTFACTNVVDSTSPPLRVLLVDDSELVHKVLKHRFGAFGWTLASAYDGQQAVKRFQSDKFAGIDMVLMDLCMPVMDGRRAIGALLEMGCEIPIFVLTAMTAAGGDGALRGVEGVLHKPLQIPTLVSELLCAYKKKCLVARMCY